MGRLQITALVTEEPNSHFRTHGGVTQFNPVLASTRLRYRIRFRYALRFWNASDGFLYGPLWEMARGAEMGHPCMHFLRVCLMYFKRVFGMANFLLLRGVPVSRFVNRQHFSCSSLLNAASTALDA